MSETTDRTRRRRRRADSTLQGISQTDYRRLVNPFEPPRVIADDQVDQIHRSALGVLADAGIRVNLAEARQRFHEAGGTPGDDDLVRLDPEMVEEALATAPEVFDVVPRNASRAITIGGHNVTMVPVAGPPHVTDIDRGKRNGTLADFENFIRLTQHFDVLHMTSPAVEPQDVPTALRHLDMTFASLTLSDKVPFVYSRGRGQVTDSLDMVRISYGMDRDEFVEAPRCWTVINTNSPRQLDSLMCQGIIQFAELNQVSMITPFTLAGAMAPITLSGALVLQHAEALAGITLGQIVRPGAPVVYGAFTSNVDMRSGAPAFGTPEAVLAAYASGQLARHIGLPWRSSAVSTSNTADAQAGYETMMNMMGAAQAGANVIIHTAGWIESGLSASYEKFILDVEMAQMFAEVFQPLPMSADDIGMEAIASVEPGGHFFGIEHTLKRYRNAFYEPLVFSRQNHGQWSDDGYPSAADRANSVWKEVLASFEPPPLDEGVLTELKMFVERRKAEGGALPGE